MSTAIIIFFIFVVFISISIYIVLALKEFKREHDRLKMELGRAQSDHHREHYKRRLRRHWLTLIPFVGRRMR